MLVHLHPSREGGPLEVLLLQCTALGHVQEQRCSSGQVQSRIYANDITGCYRSDSVIAHSSFAALVPPHSGYTNRSWPRMVDVFSRRTEAEMEQTSGGQCPQVDAARRFLLQVFARTSIEETQPPA